MDKLSPQSTEKSALDSLIDQSRLKLYGILDLLGLSRATWYRRMEDPETFTVSEIKKLAGILNKAKAEGQPLLTPYDIFEAILTAKSTSLDDGPKTS